MQVHSELQQKADDRQAAIAHRLALQYTILQEPAMYNIRYSAALKARQCNFSSSTFGSGEIADDVLTVPCMQEFTNLAILAYECGYDECTVKEEMATSPLEVNITHMYLQTCVARKSDKRRQT